MLWIQNLYDDNIINSCISLTTELLAVFAQNDVISMDNSISMMNAALVFAQDNDIGMM